VAAFALLFFCGCGSLTKPRLQVPSVDPQSAATQAIGSYDKDGDGQLNESELAACPAISHAHSRYDTNGDGKVSQDEIAQRLQQIYSAGIGMTEVRCTVMRGGRPLAGANVRFVPESFLEGALQPASATSNADGVATPSVPTEQLPDNLRSVALMQAGLYRVEIEHPSIPAGSKKSFGVEVDPTSREGTTPQFNL
jgi:hypothetical protein